MSIEKIEVFKANVPLKTPFVTSLGKLEKLDQIIVKITNDEGVFGWGEAAARNVVLGESSGTVESALEYLAPKLIGEDPFRMEVLVESMDEAIYGNSSAKACLDMALHDLLGNIVEKPLWKILGGANLGEIETDYTVTIDEPDQMAKSADRLVEQGFKLIKVKVGKKPEKDIERLVKIRDAIGDKIDLYVDANQGWSRQEAIYALKKMENLDIKFAEQPVKAEDIDGLSLIRSKVNIPIMADETVHSPEDAMQVIKKDAADYINIKLMKAGGFWRAKKIAAVAEAAHVQCMVGGMMSSDILGTAATHLAGALKNVLFRDLDMGASVETPIIKKGGSKLKKNMRTLPQTPGLGIEEINKNLLGKPLKTYN